MHIKKINSEYNPAKIEPYLKNRLLKKMKNSIKSGLKQGLRKIILNKSNVLLTKAGHE